MQQTNQNPEYPSSLVINMQHNNVNYTHDLTLSYTFHILIYFIYIYFSYTILLAHVYQKPQSHTCSNLTPVENERGWWCDS